jgi:hypothetical protein
MRLELEKKGVKLLKQKTSINLNVRDRCYLDRCSIASAQTSARQQEQIWAKSAGIFKDDPLFEEFQQEIQSYRDELNLLNSQSTNMSSG